MLRVKTMAVVGLLLLSANVAKSQDVPALVKTIRAVGPEAKGAAAAANAWRTLSAQDVAALTPILAAFDGANPLAANYLRAAVDTIAERTLQAGKTLPAGELEAFVLNRKNAPAARRLAYEWLVRVDPAAPKRLLSGMLDDPGRELRRDAVAEALEKAQTLFDGEDKQAAKAAYQKVLDVARDRDQVELIAERLKKLGTEIDLTDHFGFITHWQFVGPFDSTDGVGFNSKFPPDEKVDLKATYKGKSGKALSWAPTTTKERLGLVDFNKIIGDVHGAVAFARTIVIAPEERAVEVRAASNNAVRIYLNGKEIFFREEYHHGMRMDQHIGRGVLKAGRNEIVVKVCQNEQTESWAQQWSFQLRVTDELGARVPLTVATE